MKLYNAGAFFFFKKKNNHCFVWGFFVTRFGCFGFLMFLAGLAQVCIAAAVTPQSICAHTYVLVSFEISFPASKEKETG